MQQEGPPLESLLRRMQECPPEFSEPPVTGSGGRVAVAAVVGDLLRDYGAAPTSKELEPFRGAAGPEGERWLRMVLLGAWLLYDPWFRERSALAAGVLAFLREGARELAALVPPHTLQDDPDRREELVRLALRDLGYRPLGETVEQAQDRLATLSTAERQRVIREAQAAEERARQVREAMARREAEEAAARYMRE